MAQIFKQQKEWLKKPARNNFDLSFDNNFTTKIGQLTPVFLKEVMPGDKFRINASIGLRAFPLAFPVQSPLQAHLSFYYVPNRIVWQNWRDFMSDTQDHAHPYLSIPYTRAGEIGTGTLADYLGIPTTYADDDVYDWFPYSLFGDNTGALDAPHSVTAYEFNPNDLKFDTYSSEDPTPDDFISHSVTYSNLTTGTSTTTHRALFLSPYPSTGSSMYNTYLGQNNGGVPTLHTDKIGFPLPQIIECTPVNFTDDGFQFTVLVSQGDTYMNSTITAIVGYSYSYDASTGKAQLTLQTNPDSVNVSAPYYLTFYGYYNDPQNGPVPILDGDLDPNPFGDHIVARIKTVATHDVSPLSNPFVIQEGDSVPDIKLNVLPWRCYEAIYNCYYRNQNDVDPFIIGGQKQYNRFVTNLSDGADSTTPLNLRNVNYELDYLTSCLLSPQFGEAPLVGVSATGTFTFEDEQGQTFKVIPKIGDDGDTLTGIDAYQEGTPETSLQRLRNVIKYGISISDFRNVNSFQRFLENHLRRGLKYENVVASHYGVEAMRYRSADEPIYLGGITRTINVTQITATAQSDGVKLGDYVGQAGLFTGMKHDINHYCDENGFIIGVLSLVPIPTYSQLLPKHYIKENLLSYPFPLEFRHISLQPIDYREVTPIQAKMANKPYTDTFGYQRPYYDFIASVDENHSHFRTDMQGYVFTRNFGEPPELGKKFITIDPAEMTNPFIDTDPTQDTFIGQIHFDVKAKRPLARIHEPRLE